MTDIAKVFAVPGEHYGTPVIRNQLQPMVMARGQVRPMNVGETLPACFTGGAGGGGGGGTDSQTLSVVGNTLNISGGNSVAIPREISLSSAPPSTGGNVLSTNVIGTNTAILANPAAWYRIAGTNLVIPAFSL